ncbi:TPA: ribonuclease III [Candidatus Sumerlaeota bacterium]|jgi:ribonuclease III|nr:ribonuclease III [Candidatus Sumerlaeota bacterium]
MTPDREKRICDFLDRHGLSVQRCALIDQALTHCSYAFEHAGHPDNERLEFLGDAVLGCMAAEFLFSTHPDLPEGQLSRMRSFLVCGKELWRRACELGMDDLLLLGKGEEETGGRHRVSNVGSALEALVGALYLENPNSPELKKFVLERIFKPGLNTLQQQMHPDHKTRLQEMSQSRGMGNPTYHRMGEEGPAHERCFHVEVRIKGVSWGKGKGARVKTAENHAAKVACEAMLKEKK